MQKNSKQLITTIITGSLALALSLQSSLINAKERKKTEVQAQRSTELKVDPNFNFDTSRRIILDVSVTNELNQANANAILKVYAVEDPGNAPGVKRRLKRTLIAVLRTNESGWVESEVEIPQHYRDLVIENTELSMDDTRYVRFEGQERFIVKF